MARRSKYTPETVDKLTQAIRLGATYKLACDYAGIGERTFYDWLAAHPQFSQDIKQAEGEGAIKHLANIDRAANGIKNANGDWVELPDWKASAWKLERRYPEMYGRNRVELTGAEGKAVQIEVDVTKLSDDELRKLAGASGADRTGTPPAGDSSGPD